MGRIIQVSGNVANAGAPRIIRTPGVGGYAARFIAAHIDQTDGAAIASLPSVSGTVPTTLTKLGTGTSKVVMGTDNGYRHLYSPGDFLNGGRLLGPHTAQRPMTVAMVVKASAGVTAFAGMTGTSVSRNASSYYQGVSSSVAAPLVNHEGWVFFLVAQAADNSFIARTDATEATQATGAAAPGTNGGLYFGASAAGQASYVRELLYWPSQLTPSQRDAVHAYMKSRYIDLV